ncbi:hypothetical protein EVAR_14995_1 [Eumeta japonica]|uniref:Uncharacterized protein n=1 Tax=Eumeta variegata TaxID=151549 RepID=A0A4C1X9G8_EUMVA|nr:hypothetical protein EVAR_14995_1 [Eumeta japonica]
MSKFPSLAKPQNKITSYCGAAAEPRRYRPAAARDSAAGARGPLRRHYTHGSPTPAFVRGERVGYCSKVQFNTVANRRSDALLNGTSR